ncbi:hypothetical protein ACFL5O_02850 [Myxococcota bacterium]
MRTTAIIGTFSVITLLLAASCSSKENQGDPTQEVVTGNNTGNSTPLDVGANGNGSTMGSSSGSGSGAGDGSAATTGPSTGAQDGASNGAAPSAGSGNTSAVKNSWGIAAADTDYGVVEISEDQALTLKDPANVEQACAGWAAEPEIIIEGEDAVIEFVVDVSSTMDETAPNGGGRKIDITKAAFHNAIEALSDNVYVGLIWFPNMNITPGVRPCLNTSNNIEVGPLAENRDAVHASIDAVDAPPGGMGTPIHDAFNYAMDDIRANAPQNLPRYIAVLTDGQPTISLDCTGQKDPCTPEPTDPIVQAVQGAFSGEEVSTFMISTPGSENSSCGNLDFRDWMSQAAELGGTGKESCSHNGSPDFCHIDISQSENFQLALEDALGQIVGTVVSAVKCTYAVPLPPTDSMEIDQSKATVIYTDGHGLHYIVLPNDSPNCDRGWHYINGGTEVELCDITCDAITNNPDAALDVIWGCSAEEYRLNIVS